MSPPPLDAEIDDVLLKVVQDHIALAATEIDGATGHIDAGARYINASTSAADGNACLL